MTPAEIMEKIRTLSNSERLALIEATTRLVREDLTTPEPGRDEELDRRMRASALALKAYYEPGAELTEWTGLDAEEFLDDSVQR
jgi:hypothetical protein